MAERYGGKFSPGAGAGDKWQGRRRSRMGARANALFIVPIPLVFRAFGSDPLGLFFNLAAFGILIYVTWAFRTIPNSFRYGVAAIVAAIDSGTVIVGGDRWPTRVLRNGMALRIMESGLQGPDNDLGTWEQELGMAKARAAMMDGDLEVTLRRHERL